MKRPHATASSFGVRCAVVVLTLLVGASAGAPVICALIGQDPTTFHPEVLDADRGGLPVGPFGGMNATHWLGVEPGTGRDLLARVLYGGRITLGVALGATLLQLVVGVAVGLVSGYGQGLLATAAGRLMDVMLAVPVIIAATAVLTVSSRSVPRPVLLAIVIGALGWASVGRLVRGQVIAERNRQYVEAARALGATTARILFREILPNLARPVLASVASLIPANVMAEAALSFLGVGIDQPAASWGQMLAGATRWIIPDPVYMLVPGALLMITVLAFHVLGESLSDNVDGALWRRRAW